MDNRNLAIGIFKVAIITAVVLALCTPAIAPGTPTIYSEWSTFAPSIDGYFSDGEWKNAQLLIPSPIHTYVYFMNDNELLYICVDAANAGGGDYTEDWGDQCSIHFDTGHDEVRTLGHEDVFWIGGEGKWHFVAGDIPSLVEHCTVWPGIHPGLQGSRGFAVSPNSANKHRIYEFRIPLELLEAAPGDTLGFASPQFFWSSIPYDASSGQHNVWPPGATMDNMSTWGDLVLASPPQASTLTPIALIALVSLLSAIAAVTIVRKRR